MSVARTCSSCFRREAIRHNFDGDSEAERAFHAQTSWCGCGYITPQEMMQDQDLGFSDPAWFHVGRRFLTDYHDGLHRGVTVTPEEHMRYFLKLFQSTTATMGYRVELIPDETLDVPSYGFIKYGKREWDPKVTLFPKRDMAYVLKWRV